MSRTRIGAALGALIALTAVTLVFIIPAAAADGRVGFGFNAPSISGFPTGEAFLTGGGAFDPASGFVHSSGGFRCLATISQGPLAGCLAGQGVRWDTEAVLPSIGFKCTGALTEPGKTAVTDAHTVVLESDFYRAGDGNDESFTAKIIVSDHDLAGDIDGVQNIWIEKVGCGTADVNFSS
jgi:hypothetical protein